MTKEKKMKQNMQKIYCKNTPYLLILMTFLLSLSFCLSANAESSEGRSDYRRIFEGIGLSYDESRSKVQEAHFEQFADTYIAGIVSKDNQNVIAFLRGNESDANWTLLSYGPKAVYQQDVMPDVDIASTLRFSYTYRDKENPAYYQAYRFMFLQSGCMLTDTYINDANGLTVMQWFPDNSFTFTQGEKERTLNLAIMLENFDIENYPKTWAEVEAWDYSEYLSLNEIEIIAPAMLTYEQVDVIVSQYLTEQMGFSSDEADAINIQKSYAPKDHDIGYDCYLYHCYQDMNDFFSIYINAQTGEVFRVDLASDANG